MQSKNLSVLRRLREGLRSFFRPDLSRAVAPTKFPERLVRFLLTVVRVFFRTHCFERSASLTFASLFSLFPLVAVLLFIIPLFFTDVDTQQNVQRFILSSLIPATTPRIEEAISQQSGQTNGSLQETNQTDVATTATGSVAASGGPPQDVLQRYFNQYLETYKQQRGKIGAVGLIALLLAAIVLFIIVERTFNEIWKVKRPRSFLKASTIFTGMIIWIPLFIGLSFYLTAELGKRSETIGTGHKLLPIVLVFLALNLAYLYLPNTKVRLRNAALGAAIVTILWEMARASLGTSVEKLTNYTNLLQTVGAIPFFLSWLYVSWVIILLGVVIAYCSQNLRHLMIEDISKTHDVLDASVLLSILFVVGDYFATGKGGITFSELRNTCPLQTQALTAHLSYLEERSIVQFIADEETYILKMPPEKIYLKDFIDFEHKAEQFFFYDEAAKKRFLSRLAAIDGSLSQILRDQTLANLLQQD
jgi:YihY family inner membrane protein